MNENDILDDLQHLQNKAEANGYDTMASILKHVANAYQATRELDVEMLLNKWQHEFFACNHELGAWVDTQIS